MSPETLRKWQSRWTPEEKQQLSRLAERGFSAAAIADTLHRERNAVCAMARRMGVKLRSINK